MQLAGAGKEHLPNSHNSFSPNRIDRLSLQSWIHFLQKEVLEQPNIHHSSPNDTIDIATELLNIHNAFHQGQYDTVIDFDTSSLSSENKIPARVLQLRAQIANGQVKAVLSSNKREGDAPDFTAVKAFAQYTSGNTSAAVSEIEKLAERQSENATVQLLGGTVLQAAGKTEEALSLLSKHQGSLEAYDYFLASGIGAG